MLGYCICIVTIRGRHIWHFMASFAIYNQQDVH